MNSPKSPHQRVSIKEQSVFKWTWHIILFAERSFIRDQVWKLNPFSMFSLFHYLTSENVGLIIPYIYMYIHTLSVYPCGFLLFLFGKNGVVERTVTSTSSEL